LGSTRDLLLRRNSDGRVHRIPLPTGSLFVMTGATQQLYQHCIPKTKLSGPRISLTFRTVRIAPLSVPRTKRAASPAQDSARACVHRVSNENDTVSVSTHLAGVDLELLFADADQDDSDKASLFVNTQR
jgi:hypothetical protein